MDRVFFVASQLPPAPSPPVPSRWGTVKSHGPDYSRALETGLLSDQKRVGDSPPFVVERDRSGRPCGTIVPVGCVGRVSLFAMKVGVHPGAIAAFVVLDNSVGPIPVAMCVEP